MKGSVEELERLMPGRVVAGPAIRMPEPDAVRTEAIGVQAALAPQTLALTVDLGSKLSAILRLCGIPHKPEYHFAKPRMWRFDVAFPDVKLAVECDGGLHIEGGGGHNSPAGFKKDLEKRNRAQILGWCVLVVTGGMIESGEALTLIEEGLAARQPEKPGTPRDTP